MMCFLLVASSVCILNCHSIFLYSSTCAILCCHFISRSYCYTVWSAIGIILSSVCPSVCLRRCALWFSGLVSSVKSCTGVFLAGIFLFVPSHAFAVGCRAYCLATKCTTKNESKKHVCIRCVY